MLPSRLFFKIISKNQQVYWLQLTSLAIGFACASLILLFTFHEFGFDRFYPNADQLFRVLKKNEDPNFSGNRLSNKIEPETFEQLKKRAGNSSVFSRVRTLKGISLINQDQIFTPDYVHAVDSSFIPMLSIQMNDVALNSGSSNQVYISMSASRKLFGASAAGKFFNIVNELDTINCMVVGVFKDLPANSHETWDVLMLYNEKPIHALGFDPKEFGVYAKTTVTVTFSNPPDAKVSFHFQPLPEIYFGPRVLGEESKHGDEYSIRILIGISLLILLLSVSNFVNLTTVVLPYRAKEIAVKKLAGSSEFQLIISFLKESLFTAVCAFVIALAVLISFSDAIKPILALNVRELIFTGDALFFGWMAFLIMLVSLTPQLITFSFVKSSPNKLISTDAITFPRFKRVITFIQLSLSIFLLMASIVVGRQIQYSLIKEPGRNHEQIVYLKYPWTLSAEQLRILQQQWKNTNPNILGLMATSQLPHLVNSKEIGSEFYFMSVDPDFNNFFNLHITKGRWFKPNDPETTCLVNTVGESLAAKKNQHVIGVFQDINGQFNQPARPLKLRVTSDYPFNYLCLRILEVDIQHTVNYLGKVFETAPSNIHFLDHNFAEWMNYQDQLNTFSRILTVISMILSCCCVYGLGLSLLNEKHKQITIHKMFGATTSNITILLLKTFSRELIAAICIVVPLTFLVLQEFLRAFVYITPFHWTDPAYPVAFCLVIIGTLCIYHAAILNRANLSDALRS
jgi:putative ABC transport system permease protein